MNAVEPRCGGGSPRMRQRGSTHRKTPRRRRPSRQRRAHPHGRCTGRQTRSAAPPPARPAGAAPLNCRVLMVGSAPERPALIRRADGPGRMLFAGGRLQRRPPPEISRRRRRRRPEGGGGGGIWPRAAGRPPRGERAEGRRRGDGGGTGLDHAPAQRTTGRLGPHVHV